MSEAGRRPGLCVLRGGGDLATGVAWRLTRAGWPVVACELPSPLTVRRSVAVSSAVFDGEIDIDGMRAVLAADVDEATELAATGVVAVLVSPELADLDADVVVDARVAKRNIDTSIDDAPLVIGLGPGFVAGVDCDCVVETQRGSRLGRVLWSGAAAADTGTPGVVGGRGVERVLRAPTDGAVAWDVAIGDLVEEGQRLGRVGDFPIDTPFAGVVRGLISERVSLTAGMKIGDVDPRCEPSACTEISDKALAIGGGVVEAVLTWLNR